MIYLFLICGILLLIIYMYYKAHHDIIDHQTIFDERLPNNFEGFRCFFIADIHRRKINEKTLEKIYEKIDIVVIGGDLIEKGVPFHRIRNNIKKLKKFNAPVFFIWGNNDYEVSINKLINILTEEHVIILRDTYTNIMRKQELITLIGFDYNKEHEGRRKIKWEQIKGHYIILLTHKPSSFDHLTPQEQSNIHTVLAGHTHGGQVRLFGLGLYQNGGLIQRRETNIFITEGYGYSLLPFRLQTNAECHVITFKKE